MKRETRTGFPLTITWRNLLSRRCFSQKSNGFLIRSNLMRNLAPQEGLIERIYLLIRLRWIAVAGVIFTVLFAEKIVNIPLQSLTLYAIAVVLGVYNLIFFLYLNRIKRNNPPNLSTTANHIANIQISLDLLSLTALI